jgi:hypothetical protein
MQQPITKKTKYLWYPPQDKLPAPDDPEEYATP